MLEVEAPDGLHGSKLVKVELKAIHEGKTATIKALCDPQLDVFNEHNKHYFKLVYHTISDKDLAFIKEFADAHS
jgi:predicted solute-binding protein